MNTPSKEALEAAESVAINAVDLVFERYVQDAAAIIDRHFESLRQRSDAWEKVFDALAKTSCFVKQPKGIECALQTIDNLVERAEQAEALSQRLAEMESRLESEKATRNAIIAKGQQTEARVKELDELYRDLRVAYEQNAEQCVKLNRELGLKKETTEWLNGATIQRQRAERAEARVKELEAACAELVTDGNAITLAANLARQSERVKELEGMLALASRQRDYNHEKIAPLRAANAELQKQEAESRRLFYAEQDKRQSAEFRCEELAGALYNARLALKALGRVVAVEAIDAALARHAAGEPAIDSLLAVTPAYTTEMRGRLQKAADAADAVDAGEPEAQT